MTIPPPPPGSDPYGAPPPPQPGTASPTSGPSPYPTTPGGYRATAGPRSPLGPIALIAGSVLMIVGTFLPWVTGNGQSANGWDLADLTDESNDAAVYVGMGVILIILAGIMIATGTKLALAIIATLISVFATIAAVIDVTDDGNIGDFGFKIGAGLYVVLLGALVCLAGSVLSIVLSRRRA